MPTRYKATICIHGASMVTVYRDTANGVEVDTFKPLEGEMFVIDIGMYDNLMVKRM